MTKYESKTVINESASALDKIREDHQRLDRYAAYIGMAVHKDTVLMLLRLR